MGYAAERPADRGRHNVPCARSVLLAHAGMAFKKTTGYGLLISGKIRSRPRWVRAGLGGPDSVKFPMGNSTARAAVILLLLPE